MDTESLSNHQGPKIVIPQLGLLVVVLAHSVDDSLTEWLLTQTVTLPIDSMNYLLPEKSISLLINGIYFVQKSAQTLIM